MSASALDEARAITNLACGREGPETNEQAALVAIAYGIIAMVESLNSKTNIKLIEENADLLARIHELETYNGPNCPRCGSQNQIRLSTRAQCPQCNKIYTVK